MPSVLAVLGAVLVVLKALGHTDLSWFWVLAPFWLGAAFALLLLGISRLLVGAALKLAGKEADQNRARVNDARVRVPRRY